MIVSVWLTVFQQLYYNDFTCNKRHEVSSAYEIVRILGTHFWNFVWAWNFCQIFHQREPWTILRFSLRLILFENWTIKKEKTFCGFYNHFNADIARCDEIPIFRVCFNTLNFSFVAGLEILEKAINSDFKENI